jgi:hypothetical protein
MHPIPHGIGAHARWSRLQPMPDADHGEPIVTLTDAPTAEEEHAVGSGLARFNEQQSGIRDSRPLAVVVRDPQTKQPVGGVLYTISFQAPGFYERHGYRVLGTVPCLPLGTSRVFMTKPLT